MYVNNKFYIKNTSATCSLHRVQGQIMKTYIIFHDLPLQQQVAPVVFIQEPLLNIQCVFTSVNKLMQ